MIRTMTTVAISFAVVWAAQADWPQFLGPDRNAAVENAPVAKSWPDGGPKRLWTLSLGEGFGGASIHGAEVFVLDRIEEETDVMRCLDLDSGEEKWCVAYAAPGKNTYPGSRSVPSVDEEHVWSVGAFGHLSCINRSTHEIDWITNIIEEFDVDMPMFGIAQSPLIYEDLVIVAPQGKKAGLVAYDKRSGELRWATRKLMGQPWMVSPIAATFGGTDQIVMTSPYDRENEQFSNEVISVDASNGEILWIYTGLYSFATIASPKVIDDTRLFLTCGSYNGNYRPVSIMLDVRRSGGEFAITELFKTEEAGSKIHAAVRHGDYLYLNSGDRGEAMTCMSLDGEVVWQGPGFHLGGPILVGDLIMNQHGKSGDVYLIEATPNGYNELGHAELSSRGKNTPWGPLAFSDGKLLVRHSSELICLDLTGAK